MINDNNNNNNIFVRVRWYEEDDAVEYEVSDEEENDLHEDGD